MTQSQENGQKPHFGPNFEKFWPYWAIFFSKITFLITGLAWYKKAKKCNGGKYENYFCLVTDGRTDRAGLGGGANNRKFSVWYIDPSFVLIMFTNSLRDFECVLSRCSNLIGVSTINFCTSLLHRHRPLRDRIYFRSESNLEFCVQRLK